MTRWFIPLLASLATLAACSPAIEAPSGQVVIIPPPSAVADQAITSPEPAAPPAPPAAAPAPAVASLNLPSATVISVGDGDTIRMDYQGQNITVRLACIDAPETSQTPWGQPPPTASDNSPLGVPPFSSERPIPTDSGAWWPNSTRVAKT